MPSRLSACFITRLMPGAETFSSRAAPPTVPVTMMARITSICLSVSIPGARIPAAEQEETPDARTDPGHRHQRRGDGDLHRPPRARRAVPRGVHADGRTGHPRGA